MRLNVHQYVPKHLYAGHHCCSVVKQACLRFFRAGVARIAYAPGSAITDPWKWSRGTGHELPPLRRKDVSTQPRLQSLSRLDRINFTQHQSSHFPGSMPYFSSTVKDKVGRASYSVELNVQADVLLRLCANDITSDYFCDVTITHSEITSMLRLNMNEWWYVRDCGQWAKLH